MTTYAAETEPKPMEILEIRTLRGPNYWSGYWKKLIVMRLDIGAYEDLPTDRIEGFSERMLTVMPSLRTHGCSYKEEGGFQRRVEEGTWAGHVIEHFALELQTLAGMDTGYGRTRDFDLYILGNFQVDNFGLNTLNRSVNPAGGQDAIALFQRVQHLRLLPPLLVRRGDDQEVEDESDRGDRQDVEEKSGRAAAGALKQSNRMHD